MPTLLATAAVLFGVGTYLLIDGLTRPPRHKSLTERIVPFVGDIAADAEDWLRRQG